MVSFWVSEVTGMAQPPMRPLGQWYLVWVALVGPWSPQQVVMQSPAGNLPQKSWVLFLKCCSCSHTRVIYEPDLKNYYSLFTSLMLVLCHLGAGQSWLSLEEGRVFWATMRVKLPSPFLSDTC